MTLIRVIGWIGAAFIGIYGVFQGAEYFYGKYQTYGPGIRTAARAWWLQSPWVSTICIGLGFGLVVAAGSGVAFYVWAQSTILTSSLVFRTPEDIAWTPQAVRFAIPIMNEGPMIARQFRFIAEPFVAGKIY